MISDSGSHTLYCLRMRSGSQNWEVSDGRAWHRRLARAAWPAPGLGPKAMGTLMTDTLRQVKRRYREFLSLHKALQRRFPDLALPALPPRKFIGSSMSKGGFRGCGVGWGVGGAG